MKQEERRREYYELLRRLYEQCRIDGFRPLMRLSEKGIASFTPKGLAYLLAMRHGLEGYRFESNDGLDFFASGPTGKLRIDSYDPLPIAIVKFFGFRHDSELTGNVLDLIARYDEEATDELDGLTFTCKGYDYRIERTRDGESC